MTTKSWSNANKIVGNNLPGLGMKPEMTLMIGALDVSIRPLGY